MFAGDILKKNLAPIINLHLTLILKHHSVIGDVNYRSATGEAPLTEAAYSGHTDIAELLLLSGAKLEARNWSFETAFLCAVIRGHNDMIKLLIEYGCDTGVTNLKGRSALHMAIACGTQQTVQILLDNGVDIDARDRQGDTPLFSAVYLSKEAMVNILLQSGCNINNTSNKDGWSPLIQAAHTGKYKILGMLLRAGADVTQRDSEGHNALNHALMTDTSGQYIKECVKLLQIAGEDMDITSSSGDVTSCGMENTGGKSDCMEVAGVNGDEDVEYMNISQVPTSEYMNIGQVPRSSDLNADSEYMNIAQVPKVNSNRSDVYMNVMLRKNIPTLIEICRKYIRYNLLHLTGGRNKNLLVAVPQLPLPDSLRDYLLYQIDLKSAADKNANLEQGGISESHSKLTRSISVV